MLYDHIIIDGNNLYARNYFVNMGLANKMPNGKLMITGGVYGFLRSVIMIKEKYLTSSGKLHIIFDGHYLKRDNYRRKIDKEYKANRTGTKDEHYFPAMNYLKHLLLYFDDNQVIFSNHSHEADDLVLPIINKLFDTYSKDVKILLVSDDLDWYRPLSYSNNINIFAKKEIVNREKFKQEYGFEIKGKSLTMYKSFRGDGSDNIPIGVLRIRKNLLIRLISDYDNFDSLFFDIENIKYLNQKWKGEILKSKDRLIKNYMLVDFKEIDKDDFESIIKECSFNYKILNRYYNKLGFNKNFDKRLRSK